MLLVIRCVYKGIDALVALDARCNQKIACCELSPESETLSGDIFMSKKLSAEIRYQVLLMLRQGARAQTIATQLRLTKSWVQQCQYRFDLGDLTWLDPTIARW